MEEEGTAYGTVRRQQTYPYGSATGFFACKVKLACSEEPEENLQSEWSIRPNLLKFYTFMSLFVYNEVDHFILHK